MRDFQKNLNKCVETWNKHLGGLKKCTAEWDEHAKNLNRHIDGWNKWVNGLSRYTAERHECTESFYDSAKKSKGIQKYEEEVDDLHCELSLDIHKAKKLKVDVHKLKQALSSAIAGINELMLHTLKKTTNT